MSRRVWVIQVLVLVLAAAAVSGWAISRESGDDRSISKEESMNLQLSFMKQYGTDATITQLISPKIYEAMWTKDGNTNVSVNFGGVWVTVASTPTKEK